MSAIKRARDLLAGMRAPGHFLWSTWQIETLTAALDEQAKEIARLTAELAEVPADVEVAIDQHERRVTLLVTSMTGRAADDAAGVDIARDTLRAAIARAINAAWTEAIKAVEGIESNASALGYSRDYMAAIARVLVRLRAYAENGGPMRSVLDAEAPAARDPMKRRRKCEACGKLTRITTAGCDHCDLEDK